jgi:hypothetical protein
MRTLKTKIILGLALVLDGGLVGCSSIDRPSIDSKLSPELYLHLFASYLYPQPPGLILSASVPLATDFDIPTSDGQRLQGHIQPRDGKYFVYFKVRLCSGTNVFNEEVELEKRCEPAPQPYDVKAPFVCQPHFVLSTNRNPQPFLKQQAAAEKKQWQLENPLTARQLAEVERKFHLMRAGMTKDEVFAMLGLSNYQNRLLPSNPFVTRWNRGDYQLATERRLVLRFDPASNASSPLLIEAELDSVTSSSNAPSVWQPVAHWP